MSGADAAGAVYLFGVVLGVGVLLAGWISDRIRAHGLHRED